MKKGIILAGGSGSRLEPLTSQYGNKHLVPVWDDKPMITYPLRNLIDMGVDDIMLITSPQSAGSFTNLLKSGNKYNCDLTYRIQDSNNGILGALKLAKDFVSNEDDLMVILGDNFFEFNTEKFDKTFDSNIPFHLFLKPILSKASDYGIYFPHSREIVEKPKDAVEGLAVTGLYHFPSEIFHIIEQFKPSARGELEITDLNNWVIKNFYSDEAIPLYILDEDEKWLDMGTIDYLKRVRKYLFFKNLENNL